MELLFPARRDDRYVTHPHLRPPPGLVLPVPLHGALQSLLEGDSRPPVEELLRLRVVTGVPKDLARPVSDELDRDLGWSHQILNRLGDVQHGHMAAGANVDYLSGDLLAGHVE